MSGEPIIIQVLSREDHRTIRRQIMTLGLITGALFLLLLVVILQYGPDRQGVLVTGAIFLVLFGNVLLLVRNKLIDRYCQSLCLDGNRSYTVTKRGVSRHASSAHLYFKRERLTIASEPTNPPEQALAFQVLDREGWKVIKQLSALVAEDREHGLTFTRPVMRVTHSTL
jgi:hypothetical protein